ncbi:free fatty acid receptor 2-like [Chiloscyllium plagiosum]|uniref:free fatty acid receptor 2-like n=1 Tax=Chiloscyllium plagiosum TaxID=36176 RepID=UPI001CB86EC3|nr:free fatty acid receptor 2-like [Chiloscyllium plagiosum]
MAELLLSDKLHITVYVVALVTGLPFNLLALYAFLGRAKRKAAPDVIFLINLTISDLAFLLFLPFKILESAKGSMWTLPAFLCPLSSLFYFSAVYGSILFLTAVSVERYLGVAFPIQYNLYRKPTYALLVSFLLWLCAFSHCSIVYIVEYQKVTNSSRNQTVCYSNFTQSQLVVLLPLRLELGIVLFCLPFLITTFCYSSFIRILLSSPHISYGKKQRAVGLVLATLLVFLICFAPYNISHFVGFIQQSSPPWRTDALLLSTFNTSLDPIIFYFSSSAVKQTCKACLSSLSRELSSFKPFQILLSFLRKRNEALRADSFHQT